MDIDYFDLLYYFYNLVHYLEKSWIYASFLFIIVSYYF